jgi:hypothetical protein
MEDTAKTTIAGLKLSEVLKSYYVQKYFSAIFKQAGICALIKKML